jgi:hypothetical protein
MINKVLNILPGDSKKFDHSLDLDSVIGEIFGHNQLRSLVFATPIGYMLTSSGVPLLYWGIFYEFLLNGQ